ncbi:hypothetical protein D3C83_71800 [compost metagenome]
MRLGFHAFRDDPQLQATRERDDRPGNGSVVLIVGDIVHERPVDLEEVDREPFQVTQ